jgi:hypothetical protein
VELLLLLDRLIEDFRIVPALLYISVHRMLTDASVVVTPL